MNLSFTTWNCNHPSASDVSEWLPELESVCGQGVFLMQETETLKGSEFDDYRMYMTTGGRSAVLVPQLYAVSMKWDSTLQFLHYKWCSAVIIGDTGALAAYFAHSGLPESF